MASVTIPGPVRALLEASELLVSNSSSARVSIARLDGVVDPAGLPAFVRDEIGAGIARAVTSTHTPMSRGDVDAALRAAWGRPPGKVLDSFDADPIAVRSHAQVHRAELDGAAVALKVARPGVAGLMRADLTLLTTLAGPIGSAFPGIDPAAMLGEVRERVLDELDLEFEGEAQRNTARRARAFAGLRVAKVDRELSTEGVLVSEFVDAPTLESAGPPEDPGELARTLVRFYGGAVRGLGGVLANPRAGDIALAPGGGVVLLGASAFRAADRARVDAALDALQALRDADEDAFATAVADRLGVLPDATARSAFALTRELFAAELEGPWRLDHAALAELAERALERLPDLYAIATAGTLEPGDLWPGRMVGQLGALLARLGATEDWAALALEAHRAGWD
jgi:predicted unusual protein kinase regulating ubiquinone biosynthesis (AarF/ABC1/UbiB family)